MSNASSQGNGSYSLPYLSSTSCSELASPSTTSPTLRSTSSTGLGDYIASGLGLNVPYTTTSFSLASLLSNVSLSFSSTTGGVASNSTAAQTSLYPTSQPTNLSSSSNTSSLNHPTASIRPFSALSNGSNATIFSGDCWNQWEQFWSSNGSVSPLGTTTETWTSTETDTQNFFTYWTTYVTTTMSTTEQDGIFGLSTGLVTTTVPTYPDSEFPTATVTTTFTYEETTTAFSIALITPPPCVLPSFVPQCQSSWDTWAFYRYA